jgi:hypothetical protein
VKEGFKVDATMTATGSGEERKKVNHRAIANETTPSIVASFLWLEISLSHSRSRQDEKWFGNSSSSLLPRAPFSVATANI